MTTLEIEIGLMDHFGFRQNIIVPNASWGITGLHECDILVLRPSGYAVEAEIKVSKADLLKDSEKEHGHVHNHISEFYFAVPKELKEIALEVIPERAGLLVIDYQTTTYSSKIDGTFTKTKLKARCVKSPIINNNRIKWPDEDRRKLSELGCMRIFTLKKNILKLKS